jgi:hypothetical protein
VLGHQPRFLSAPVFSFPWDRFFDQGERVFEFVLLVLWLAFIAFLVFCAGRLVFENAHKRKKRKKLMKSFPVTR